MFSKLGKYHFRGKVKETFQKAACLLMVGAACGLQRSACWAA